MTEDEFNKLFDVAVQHRDRSEFAEAQQILEQLAATGTTHVAVFAMLGYVCMEQHQLDTAIRNFRIAGSLNPKSELVSVGLFHCLWEKGLRREARDEMRRFMSIAHSDEYLSMMNDVESQFEGE